ncbi:Curli production assembly/transport component CsgG [Desulfocapsa sulfexigens DSM 10523]|uniref:Curli production assembly/transport component CsgG n=1 Tax=Desulfocapsa sulfexigens (strain DSM 10523 / SB164P1) TaxID=1167006 RepID=M1NHZ9_DESSD|nr:CsgG/HfaB family protein [Desulfocapsa sulfexigens]AGF79219.1 Curli production assembly/transport component CsgG [Desulfocapsa sulfexigens DSM 10523]
MKKLLRPFLFISLLPMFLNACAGSQPQYTPEYFGSGSVVAVWNLENYSVTENQILDDMQEFLTAKVAETLKESGECIVVEREKLVLALEELSLGSSVLVDETSRLEVGRLLGAQFMVFGGFQQVGEQLRIDLRLIEVASGAVVRTGVHTIRADNVSALLAAVEAVTAQLF